jgi:tagatose 1,6-diphosphate aldolase GatY/KbaY
MAMAVLEAARLQASGVVVLISEKSFVSPHGAALATGLRAMAEHAPIPVCLQLDHVSDLAQIEAAFKLGVGAVMADGSRLPFEENIAFVRQAVQIASSYSGSIEAELGRIEGNEDIALATQAGAFTDPEQAAFFVEATGASCLAVSIGNVHGVYQHPPRLDWERLERISEQVTIPLSLHGASGLPDTDLRAAIARGICKINVNTELRSQYLNVVAEQLPRVLSGARLLELQNAEIAALTQAVQEKMEVYT